MRFSCYGHIRAIALVLAGATATLVAAPPETIQAIAVVTSGDSGFTGFEAPVYDGVNVAFIGRRTDNAGVYVGTSTPEGIVNLGGRYGITDFDSLSFAEGQLLIRARTARGTLSLVETNGAVHPADALAPGKTRPRVFASDDSDCNPAIFIQDHFGLRTLIAKGDLFSPTVADPAGRPQIFGAFADLVIRGDDAAFLAADSYGESAIFITDLRKAALDLRMVVSEHETVPSRTPNPNAGFFLGFVGSPSLDGANVAFQGMGSAGEMGIFVWNDDAILPIILRGESIGGRVVEDMRLSSQAMSNGRIVYSVVFADGTCGIFISQVPTPSPLERWSQMTRLEPTAVSSSSVSFRQSLNGMDPQTGGKCHAIVRSRRSVHSHGGPVSGGNSRIDPVRARVVSYDADRAGNAQP